MLKQLFRISILSIALTLCSLLGCNSPSNIPENTLNHSETVLPPSSQPSSHIEAEPSPEEVLDDIAYIITIQVNPYFEIYVGIDDLIVSLQPLNEDAKQLCATVDVIHMTPEHGLYALISQAHDDGFLEDGDQVNIQLEYIHFSDDSKMDHANSLAETVRTYLNLNQMPDAVISVNLSSRPLLDTQDPQGETQDGSSLVWSEDQYRLEYETSADGICIYEKCLRQDGGTMEYYYSSLGILQTSIYRDGFGTMETTHYNSDGLPTNSIFYRMDGAEIHQTYGDAWNVIHEVLYEVDGSVITREYYPNSVLKLEHTLMADGSFSEVAWTEAGIQIYSKEQYTNGREGYILCHENGQTKEVYTKESNGSSFLTLYDENGNETYHNYITQSGRQETTYNEDRSGTVITYYSDGTKETQHFNSNSQIRSGIDREGKSYIIVAGERVYD